MATNNKKKKIEEPVVEQTEELQEPIKTEEPVKAEPKHEKQAPKYPIGSIVFIAKDAEADLNGFKLFPQYKKYTYTVENYDKDNKTYSLRRLNLLLKLKEDFILAPHERAHDSVNRKQF